MLFLNFQYVLGHYPSPITAYLIILIFPSLTGFLFLPLFLPLPLIELPPLDFFFNIIQIFVFYFINFIINL